MLETELKKEITMLETELKKEIMKLSDNYSFNEIDSSITGPRLLVSYKGNTVLRIYKNRRYLVDVTIEHYDFYRLPFSNKLWMLASKFAMTPVDKRFKENKYNVIIARKNSNISAVWYKVAPHAPYNIYNIATINNANLSLPEYQFTVKGYNDLIKHIKALPDGEFQAKVAEHGKTLIKED